MAFKLKMRDLAAGPQGIFRPGEIYTTTSETEVGEMLAGGHAELVPDSAAFPKLKIQAAEKDLEAEAKRRRITGTPHAEEAQHRADQMIQPTTRVPGAR